MYSIWLYTFNNVFLASIGENIKFSQTKDILLGRSLNEETKPFLQGKSCITGKTTKPGKFYVHDMYIV